MDDLLALMEENPPDELPDDEARGVADTSTQAGRSSLRSPYRRRDSNDTDGVSSKAALSHQQQQQQQLDLSVDDKVGIRMIKRKISGVELLDMISENPYHSPASLSAMSLAALNRILVDPAAVIDAATVCGKTHMMTVGIVFSNPGTRMASSGNAYCVLTVGNLNTGPALSALLFGSAYSRFCRSCVAGKVIALVNPRLLPSKNDSSHETSVAFSLNDERQLMMVADARDYGVCKAMVRAKQQHDGQWVANGKQCKHFVDKRISEYCQMHRKQEKIKSGPIKGTTAMQQLRIESRAFPTAQGGGTHVPSGPGQLTALLNLEKQSYSSQMISQFQSNASVASSLRAPANNNSKQSVRNSLLNPQMNRSMASRPTNNVHSSQKRVTTKVPLSFSRPVAKDWLQQGSKRRASVSNADSSRKRRIINTDTEGYNGTVAIPKPSKIFAPSIPPATTPRVAARTMPCQKAAKDILSQQKLLAAQLRERQSNGGVASATREQKPTKEQTSHQALKDSLFGSLANVDRDKIMAAKSHFSNEVEAEEYARSRRAIIGLEKQEATKEKKSSKKDDASAGAIQKEWLCHTCGRSFSVKPSNCLRANHRIQTRRKIQAAKTTAEKRQALSDKQAAHGGLKLGSGLEWGRWSRFS